MKTLYYSLTIVLLIFFASIETDAQSKFNRKSRKFHKAKYRTHIVNPAKKCIALKIKKNRGTEVVTKYKLGKKPAPKPMAEVDNGLSGVIIMKNNYKVLVKR